MDKRKVLGIFLILGILSTTIVIAKEYAYTPVQFYYPSDVSFEVTVVGAASSNTSSGTAPGNATEQMEFNASTANDKLVNPCRQGSGSCQQYGTTPGWTFKNIGSVGINISIVMTNQSGKMGINYVLEMNLTNWTGSLASDMDLVANETAVPVSPAANIDFVGNLVKQNMTALWLFANFTNAPPGTNTEYVNFTSRDNTTEEL